MSVQQRQSPWISPEEYLEGEKISQVRHEYVDGEVYAMAGASRTHSLISGNIFAAFHSHLRGMPCEAHSNDMKARIEHRNIFYYPDVFVTCDPRDLDAEDYSRFPKVIVEVLSPTTASIDRDAKLRDYQSLVSVDEYVLVSQDEPRIEAFRRRDGGCWEYRLYTSEEDFRFESLDLRIPMDQVYEKVRFGATGRNASQVRGI